MNYVLDDLLERLLSIALAVIESDNEQKWREFLFQYIYFLLNSEKNYIQIKSDNISIMLNRFLTKAREMKQTFPQKPVFEVYRFSGKLSLVNGVLVS